MNLPKQRLAIQVLLLSSRSGLCTNLLDNALKHTPQEGNVDTNVQFRKAGGIIYITVTDTGRGIADKHLPHTVERFYRVEATLPRVNRLPGSGLELAIAKSIIELHGGEISVTSGLGKGATFHIKLPVHQVINPKSNHAGFQ